MISRIRTHIRRDEGASAVEYGLLIAGIAAIIAVTVFVLGGNLKDRFGKTGSCVAGSTTANC
jgi:pilus assembly protein Flp/PilA